MFSEQLDCVQLNLGPVRERWLARCYCGTLLPPKIIIQWQENKSLPVAIKFFINTMNNAAPLH